MRGLFLVVPALLLAGCDKPILVKLEKPDSRPVAAQAPIGRYQMQVIAHGPSSVGDSALILDTTTGDMWKWYEYGGVGSIPFGNATRYLGRAKPGMVVGQIENQWTAK